jgi:hypothetical protein
VKLGDLAQFGQKALEFLKNSIESFYPECKPVQKQEKTENSEKKEYNEILEDGEAFFWWWFIFSDSFFVIKNFFKEKSSQNLYIIEKTSFFVNREKSFSLIMDYIESNKTTNEFSPIANDMEQVKNEKESRPNRPLLILGDEGSGSKIKV